MSISRGNEHNMDGDGWKMNVTLIRLPGTWYRVKKNNFLFSMCPSAFKKSQKLVAHFVHNYKMCNKYPSALKKCQNVQLYIGSDTIWLVIKKINNTFRMPGEVICWYRIEKKGLPQGQKFVDSPFKASSTF